MNKISKLMLIIVLYFFIFSDQLYPDIFYKISGKVVFNGNGIKDIEIECKGINRRFYKIIKTEKDGNFQIFVPNGEYSLNISKEKGRGYVSSDLAKFITIKGKNVTNVILFLEKECRVSGVVKFDDNTPIENVSIHVVNERSFSIADTESNGYYIVTGLRASDKTIVKAIIPGVELEIIENLVLTEGSVLQNINFIIPKNLSISGRIIDKDTKEVIKDSFMVITDGNNRIPVAVKSNGEFFIYNLEKQNYIIIIDHPDYGINTKSITFLGEFINIDIEIENKTDID